MMLSITILTYHEIIYEMLAGISSSRVLPSSNSRMQNDDENYRIFVKNERSGGKLQ